MSDDEKHLDLLSIFHYVLAGFTALMACFPGIYVVIGILIVTGSMNQAFPHQNGTPPPEILGWVMIVFGALFVCIGWVYAFLLFWAGRSLRMRHGHLFCTVIAAITCLHVPIGTVLGVFTLVVLMRPSVKDLFEHGVSTDPDGTGQWE